MNYCGTGRDFISVGDIDQGVAKALKKRKTFERLKPGNVIEELGLIFSDHLAKLKAHRKIYNYVTNLGGGGGGGKALTMTMTPWNLPHGQWSKKS